ncbi:MAG: 30S ribosomal protein S17e [Candidatus Hadarchaeales archaeon]
MGRVRALFIKRVARNIISQYPDKFTTDFSHNKKVLDELISHVSKTMRNKIAGYITTLLKQNRGD